MVKRAKVVHVELRGKSVEVRLQQTINIKNYAVGLINITGKLNIDWNLFRTVSLCSNVCEPSLVENTLKPVLHVITHKKESHDVRDVNNIIWLQTSGDELNNVYLYLDIPPQTPLSDADCHLMCSLVFIPLH